MGMTFAEKILAQKAGLEKTIPGQSVFIQPDHLLTHDNTAAIIAKIEPELELYGICSPDLPVIVLDHVIPAASEKTAQNHQSIRGFVEQYNIPHFFDIGYGICHRSWWNKGLPYQEC